MNDQKKNTTDKEDLNWVRAAKRGNHKAFEKLVLKYQKQIYYLVRKIVVDHDDSNDIVQDTFVKAYANLHRFDEQFSFYPWLHRIAINTTLNFQTKISRIKQANLNSGEDEIEPVASSTNPIEAMIEQEFEQQVAKSLARLPFDQRIVFILRTSEDLSYQEISEQLDISIGTVMSRLSRARAKLRELLQQYLSANNLKV